MVDLTSTVETARILRSLANALDRRRSAGICADEPCPPEIVFSTKTAEGPIVRDNALILGVEREIRLSWLDLRRRALDRMDDEVTQLTFQAVQRLRALPEPPPTPDSVESAGAEPEPLPGAMVAEGEFKLASN